MFNLVLFLYLIVPLAIVAGVSMLVFRFFGKKGCVILFGIAFISFIYWVYYSGTYSWHQKLTIAVETPNGIASGSAVTKVSWRTASKITFNHQTSYSGEATIVELGEGKFLFGLIQEDTKYLAFHTFNESWKVMSKIRGIKEVDPAKYPMLVTFGDINDPASVKQVDPNDFEASFGPGYHLKSITLEITNEKVTTGKVEKVLGWISEYKKKQYKLNGKRCFACPVRGEMRDLIGAGVFKVGD